MEGVSQSVNEASLESNYFYKNKYLREVVKLSEFSGIIRLDSKKSLGQTNPLFEILFSLPFGHSNLW
uniref:Uncharacterized protein n=1 Tax=Gloeothece verrucosa (strain PCC 7822) TaxID=497965 RepID=E0UCK3_GLOV7|nr:hypothetical protein Cyan7822_2094 [Gloeothece verrucosa PCC 7822]